MLHCTNITTPETHHSSEINLIMNPNQPNHPLITTSSDSNPCLIISGNNINHAQQVHADMVYLRGHNYMKPAAAISPAGLISSIISGNYSNENFNDIDNTEFDLQQHNHLKLPLLEPDPEQCDNDGSLVSRGICRNLEKSMASMDYNCNNRIINHNGAPVEFGVVIKEEKETAEDGVPNQYHYSRYVAEDGDMKLQSNLNHNTYTNTKSRKHEDDDDECGSMKINAEDAVAICNKKLRRPYSENDECGAGAGKVTSSGPRMTHITVERNRRKQMNEHLAILRSLMPTSYVQRADQASIIGGVVEFINELKQLLSSLEAQKRRRTYVMDALKRNIIGNEGKPSPITDHKININGESGVNTCQDNLPMMIPWAENNLELVRATSRSRVAEVEVKLVGGTHVLLRVLAPRHQPQLLHLLPTLECLSLNVLHLNITTLYQHNSILYTFTLQIGIDCRLSVDELANAVQQTFIDIHC